MLKVLFYFIVADNTSHNTIDTVTGGASFNICIWMKLMGKEKLEVMQYVLGDNIGHHKNHLLKGQETALAFHPQRFGYMTCIIKICYNSCCNIPSGIVTTTHF